MSADPSKAGHQPLAPKEPAEPILVYRLLSDSLVVAFPTAAGKEEVLQRLSGELAKAGKLDDAQAALAKVLEREAGISTTLDTGLSLPHARLDKTGQFFAALGLLPKGLPDSQQPDITIRAVLLFFSPNDPAFFQRHLQFLRHVATLFQPALIDQLLECQTSREVLAVLKAKET